MSYLSSTTTATSFSSNIALLTDDVNRTTRIAHVIFASLDYCILQDYLELRKQGSCKHSENPYRLDLKDVDNLVNNQKHIKSSSHEDNQNTPSKKVIENEPNISDVSKKAKAINLSSKSNQEDLFDETIFRDYNIWLILQKMISYVILNPQKLNQLQTVSLGETYTSGDLYATTDKEDRDITRYSKELRQRKILEELENANAGTPPMNAAEEIILKLLDSLQYLTDEIVENGSLEGVANSTNEISQENDLIIKILRGEVMSNKGSRKSLQMISLVGMQKVYDCFTSYLPTNVCDVLNTGLFENILKYWGNLFLTSKSETIELMVSSLPRILERFSNSVTLSTSQIDNRHYALKLVQRFLGNSIISQRERELSDLSKHPTAASTLIAFRNLRAIDLIVTGTEKDEDDIWDVSKERTGRFDYLYILWWLLTPEKELNVLFDYIANHSAINKEKNFAAAITAHSIIPAAMFPGNLESTGQYTTSSNIRIFVDSEKRRFRTKLDSLKIPGDFKKTLLLENVGYEI